MIAILEKLRHYLFRIENLRDETEEKADNMENQDCDLYESRMERIEALNEIVDLLAECIEQIENYNNTWKGLKSVR